MPSNIIWHCQKHRKGKRRIHRNSCWRLWCKLIKSHPILISGPHKDLYAIVVHLYLLWLDLKGLDQDNRNQFVCPTVTLRRAEDKEIICEEVHARLPTFWSRKRYFCQCSQYNLKCLGSPATFQFLPFCALIQEHLNRERHLSMDKGASSGAGCERQHRRHGNLCTPEAGHSSMNPQELHPAAELNWALLMA